MASESSINGIDSLQESDTQYGLSLLASTLAHEIRNPLQTIRLQIDAATRGASPDQALKKIEENITRLESVVERVQRLSHRYTLCPEKVNLRNLLENTLSSVNFWLGAVGIQVRNNVHWEGEPICDADQELLQQVLLNLVMNSIQAMPSGGILSVQISESLDHATIEIEDTGVGISEDVVKLVGTPFFTTKTHGSGLGLAFCKTIASMHGGSLDIESKKDVGTRVTLRISKSLRSGEENLHV